MERFPSNLRWCAFGATLVFLLTFCFYEKIVNDYTMSPVSTRERNDFLIDDGPTPNKYTMSPVSTQERNDYLIDDGPPPNKYPSLSNNDPSQCSNMKRKNVTCTSLIRGDEDAVSLSRTTKFSDLAPACMILSLAKNCTALLDVHGYVVRSLSQEEQEFPLAFTIKMHSSADQGEQLLRSIYRPHNVYCIYVDRKTIKQIFNIMQQLGRCFDNVFVVEGRQRVTYASIDLVHAELECMKILMRSSVKWKYYINLTGQEFPLRTNLEIVKILKSLNAANDVESYEFPANLQYRYKYKYTKYKNKMVKTNVTHPRFRYPIKIRKGSAYAMLTYDFVNFILNDDISKAFIEWLTDTYSPEETLFATLNSLPWAPGGYDIMTSEDNSTFLSRAIKWQTKQVDCGGRWVRGICVYGPSDLPWLVQQPQIIANKFDIQVDTTSVDCLEEVVRYRTDYPDAAAMNWSYYRKLPHALLYRNLTQKIGTRRYSEYLVNKKLEWKQRYEYAVM